ncbi:hypothetical protein HRI_002674900 [Hibiscus trionum]|uniref:Uncharacterized protein n=1 Tax=Hibiscus trionum TaxID=183268 RepID=A0A9W7I7N2_HIBTR|nr:hypothetical protein HRI_002674900 [Hibiscus trionum]
MEMEFQQDGRVVRLKGIRSKPLSWIDPRECSKVLKGTNSLYIVFLWILNAQMKFKGRSEPLPRKMKLLLQEFRDVFEEPTELPPKRGQDHRIALVNEGAVIKMKPYRYPS